MCCSPWGHKELDTTERLKNNNNLLAEQIWKKSEAIKTSVSVSIKTLSLQIRENITEAGLKSGTVLVHMTKAPILGSCMPGRPVPLSDRPPLPLARGSPAGSRLWVTMAAHSHLRSVHLSTRRMSYGSPRLGSGVT